MNEISFSVILPLYKQEEQIPFLIQSYSKALESTGENWELILIINGNSDNSYSVAKKCSEDNNRIKVIQLIKSGWGRAVKHGLTIGRGEYLCYTNSARTNIDDFIRMIRYAKVNENVVIKATRIVRESFFRKLGSVFYNLENRFLFKTPVWDVNGTPKIIPRKVLENFEIFSEDDLIDAEIMAKCFKRNIPIIAIPVVYTKRISGKSTTNIKSAVKMYLGLLKLKSRI